MVVGLDSVGGDFVLPAQRPRRILFVSGGSGITPVMSMLRTLRAEGFDRRDRIHPLRAQSAEEACYADELAAHARRSGAARLHPRRRRRSRRHVRRRPPGRRDARARRRCSSAGRLLWSTRSGAALPGRARRRASSRPCSTVPAEASGGRVSLHRQRCRASTTTAGRCWSRPRPQA